jgi:hypothetical protein
MSKKEFQKMKYRIAVLENLNWFEFLKTLLETWNQLFYRFASE